MASKKSAAPKNILAPLRVKLVEKPVKTGDVLTVLVEDDYPSRYNEASAITKAAEQLMKDLKPAMSPDAVERIFDQNAEKPWETIASVAFQDDKHNVTRISFTSKYADTTAKTVEDLFSSLKTKGGTTANVNDYIARTVEATFDSTVFQNSEGKFDQEKYDAILAAMDGVSKKLGIKNPLSTVVVVKPLPTFHARRWTDFDIAANKKISAVLPNQITFTPCPNAKTGLMVGEKEEEK